MNISRRTIHKLDSRTARQKLTRRDEPYWYKLSKGFFIGYRKGATDGSWTVRQREADGRQRYHVLGNADDIAKPDGYAVLTFDQAKKAARDWQENGVVAEQTPSEYTVIQCVRDYLDWAKEHRKSYRHMQTYAEAFIYPHFQDMPVEALTSAYLRQWQNDIANEKPRLRTSRGQPQKYRIQSIDSDEARRKRRLRANRHLTMLKAALNRGWREGRIQHKDAWVRIEKFQGTEKPRVCILTIKEANRLLNACSADLRDLVQLALLSGARYSELARLRVGDFDRNSKGLHIRESKSGRPRHVVLNEEGIAHCSRLALGRSDSEYLLKKSDGAPWREDHQHRPFREAVRAASIDASFTFHGLRHTYASLMIMNNAPLIAVAHNLGHSDTRMVERHYGHLTHTFLAETIKTTAPSFGRQQASNVSAFAATSR